MFLKIFPYPPCFLLGKCRWVPLVTISDFTMIASKQHKLTTSRHTMWACPATFAAVAKSADTKRSAGSRLIRDRHAGSALS